MRPEESDRRKKAQRGTRWFVTLHRRLIKPPYPVRIRCPSCGHPFTEVNASTITISTSFGISQHDIAAMDAWSQQKHSCGAKITLYWKA